MLRGPDVLVLLRLADSGRPLQSVRALASGAHLSLASVQRALARLEVVGLYDARRRTVPGAQAEEFLLHGARYVVPAIRGGETRGLPTAWAAAPLSDELASSSELPPVWPDRHGTVRGIKLQPLHPAAITLAREDEHFYELLALADALRGPTDARTLRLARELMRERLRHSQVA
jgi:DNA-binding transcriptional MocR family regulator